MQHANDSSKEGDQDIYRGYIMSLLNKFFSLSLPLCLSHSVKPKFLSKTCENEVGLSHPPLTQADTWQSSSDRCSTCPYTLQEGLHHFCLH